MVLQIVLVALVFLVILVAAVVAFAATKPNEIHVQRVLAMRAPPERIFALINDFHQWTVWSPYEKMDLGMKKTFSGAASGRGAVYEWDGNKKVGQGRMEIMESVPSSKVTIKLDFIKPFEGHNVAEFTMEGQGGGQGEMMTVTWAMRGPSNFMMKVMCLFMNLDKMIGKDFEAGLANMKAAVEK